MRVVSRARRRALVLVSASVVAGASCVAGLTLTPGAGARGSTGTPVVAGGAAEGKPAVPARGVYLGVDPNFSTGDGSARMVHGGTTVGDLSTLQTEIGRTVPLVSFYTGFTQTPPVPGMDQVAAQGSVPMISWHCGAPDSAVAAGAYDGVVRNAAEAYKAFGRPVFLRWFWEMNLNYGNHPTCLGTTNVDADYVAAWIRIWTIFQQVGATNVAFVWCPSAGITAKSATGFYPGSTYVDWIGLDMYDRPNYTSFASEFDVTYPTYANATYGKPMMIAETGAPVAGNNSPDQAQWVQQIGAALPAQFPYVRAVVYVDASDMLGNYILTGPGLAAFASLGRTAYFAQVG